MAEPLVDTHLIGKQPKQRYYTPDGRIIRASPAMRGTTDGGIRDANFDKGWLPTMPDVLKPYCPYCDCWHDTKEEVKKCGDKKKAFDARWERKARKDNVKENAGKEIEIANLKKELDEIKNMLSQMMNKEK